MSKSFYLVFFAFVVSFASTLFACGGSCLECHSKLRPYINDQNHHVLNECVSCHNTPSQQGQCGKDCFDCHSREKVYAQKDVIEAMKCEALADYGLDEEIEIAFRNSSVNHQWNWLEDFNKWREERHGIIANGRK